MNSLAQGLESELAALATGDEVIYVANPGNAGDALIACSTFQLLDRLDVRYRIMVSSDRSCHDAEIVNKTVLLAGGGNLVPEYHNAAGFIRRYSEIAGRFILLPASIRGSVQLLKTVSGKATIFCRERYSFEELRTQLPSADIRLADDLAFQLDYAALKNQGRSSLIAGAMGLERDLTLPVREFHAWEQQLIFRAMKRRLVKSVRRVAYRRQSQVINSFRTDCEAASTFLPKNNLDCSRVFDFGVESPFLARYSANRLLSFLSGFELIRTDRLHVCIAGIILGKQVEFYANSYYKNHAVFEHSIDGRISGVQWRGDLDRASVYEL